MCAHIDGKALMGGGMGIAHFSGGAIFKNVYFASQGDLGDSYQVIFVVICKSFHRF